MLPNADGTPTSDDISRALDESFSHLDIRVPGAKVTIINQMVDLLSKEVIGSETREIEVEVHTVHSFVLKNIQEYNSGFLSWGLVGKL